MINFNQIEDSIFIGSAPQNDLDVARLAKMGITAVVSLQSDHDLTAHRIDWEELQRDYQNNNIDIQRFPIIDFDEVDLGNRLPEPIRALASLIDAGHKVYVHCNAGICRAPGTVLGYLCHYRQMTVDQGLGYIRKNRPQANPYKNAVVRALTNLQA